MRLLSGLFGIRATTRAIAAPLGGAARALQPKQGGFSADQAAGMASSSGSPAISSQQSAMADDQARAKPLRYADVGINLGDLMYQGEYHGKKHHEADVDSVVQRALDVGCTKLMITGSDLLESDRAVHQARAYPGTCFATVGVHPCSATAFEQHPAGPADLLHQLRALATSASAEGLCVAFGEFGLDYDRLHLAPKDVQLRYFDLQLDLAVELGLPLFLHSRAAAADFERLLRPRLARLPRSGLVHSFTGSLEEMRSLVALGLDIGVNGCSLKTEENLAVVREIPLAHMQIETDGPWCEIRPSHAASKHLLADAPPMPKALKKEKFVRGSMVKGRNESCTIPLVALVVASVKGVPVEEVCEAAWRNSIRMFGLGEERDAS